MYTYYLKDEDMLELSHIPVIELFNEAANEDLVIFLKIYVNKLEVVLITLIVIFGVN